MRKIICLFLITTNCYAIPVMVSRPPVNTHHTHKESLFYAIFDGVIECQADITSLGDRNRKFQMCVSMPKWNVINYYSFETYLKISNVCKNAKITHISLDKTPPATFEIYYKCNEEAHDA